MINEFNEKGHPRVFTDESVNTEQLKDKCIKAIESLSGVHGAAERKAEACFMIALSELENNWKQRAESAEAKLAGLVTDESGLADRHIAWLNTLQRPMFSDEDWEELTLYTWLAFRDSFKVAIRAAGYQVEGE